MTTNQWSIYMVPRRVWSRIANNVETRISSVRTRLKPVDIAQTNILIVKPVTGLNTGARLRAIAIIKSGIPAIGKMY